MEKKERVDSEVQTSRFLYKLLNLFKDNSVLVFSLIGAVFVLGAIITGSIPSLATQPNQVPPGSEVVAVTAVENIAVTDATPDALKKRVYSEFYIVLENIDGLLSNRGNTVLPEEDDRTDSIEDSINSILKGSLLELDDSMRDSFLSYSNSVSSYRGGYIAKEDFFDTTAIMRSNIDSYLNTVAEEKINQMYNAEPVTDGVVVKFGILGVTMLGLGLLFLTLALVSNTRGRQSSKKHISK